MSSHRNNLSSSRSNINIIELQTHVTYYSISCIIILSVIHYFALTTTWLRYIYYIVILTSSVITIPFAIYSSENYCNEIPYLILILFSRTVLHVRIRKLFADLFQYGINVWNGSVLTTKTAVKDMPRDIKCFGKVT